MFTYAAVWTLNKGHDLQDAIASLRNDNKGVTAMEYGIIAAVTVAAVGGAIVAIGGSLTTIWGSIKTTMATAAG